MNCPIYLNHLDVSRRLFFNSPNLIGHPLYIYPCIYRLKCISEYMISNQVVGGSNRSRRAIKTRS